MLHWVLTRDDLGAWHSFQYPEDDLFPQHENRVTSQDLWAKAFLGDCEACVPRVLYVSYDGVLEPLGESQVIAYLEYLSRQGRITLISFEKKRDLAETTRVEKMRSRLGTRGIEWVPLRYHKRPLVASTAYDVLRALTVSIVLTRSRRIQLVHARGYVAALVGLALKRLFGVRFLFDMRGFWADEKVDGGHWSRDSLIYAMTKRWERSFLESADAVVCLTHEGAKAIPELGYRLPPTTSLRVIPTCADLQAFSPGPKDKALVEALGLSGFCVVGCVGTMSNWYLRQAMLEYLSLMVKKLERMKILIVTRDDHQTLYEDAMAAGIPGERLVLTQADFSRMPSYIRLMDLGMFFIRVCFSKRGSAATKLGEFLACGVPVIINDGVGDSGPIVRRHSAGVVLANATIEEFEASFTTVSEVLRDPGIGKRCREVAERYFDLEAGVRQYHELYTELIAADAAQR